jgi:hypothetical protein
MLFLIQIALAQVEIVRFYRKIVSSQHFKVLCGMVILPFLAISVVMLSVVCFPVLCVVLPVVGVCALAYGLIYHRGQNRSVAIVGRLESEPVPSVEWMIADYQMTVDNMILDAKWEVAKFITVRQYETFNPFDGMTFLSIPEGQFWTNVKDEPIQQILFHEDDLIECSVNIAVLPKKELFALAKSHGLKVSGKGRTLDVIRSELFKIMYGK